MEKPHQNQLLGASAKTRAARIYPLEQVEHYVHCHDVGQNHRNQAILAGIRPFWPRLHGCARYGA